MLASRPPERRPNAIFAVNDLIALGLLQELALGHGIRVPEDIAVIGYDDVECGESSLIPLSSIRVPHEGFGHAAVDLLVNEMSEHLEDVSRQTVFQPELVVRASTVGHSPRT